MHLVDQVQNDRDGLVIDAEILTQVVNELRSGEVDVGEHGLGVGLRRNEPAGGDPCLQRVLVQTGAEKEFLQL